MNDKQYYFSLYRYHYKTWVPKARESAALTHFPEQNSFLLYGGVSSEPMNGLASLNIYNNTTCKWDLVYPQYACEESKVVGRYGFRSVYYNKKMYMIFGCQVYDKGRKERMCLNEIIIYNPFSKEIDIAKPGDRGERFLKPRKYFAGFLLDGQYYTHGGIDTKGKVLKEFIRIDLNTFNWEPVPLVTKADGSDFNTEHVAGHCMTLVTQKRKFVKLTELGDMDYGLAPFYIKHEGAYSFGGVFGRRTAEQRLCNKLFYFPVGTKAKPRFREIEC